MEIPADPFRRCEAVAVIHLANPTDPVWWWERGLEGSVALIGGLIAGAVAAHAIAREYVIPRGALAGAVGSE